QGSEEVAKLMVGSVAASARETKGGTNGRRSSLGGGRAGGQARGRAVAWTWRRLPVPYVLARGCIPLRRRARRRPPRARRRPPRAGRGGVREGERRPDRAAGADGSVRTRRRPP